MDKRWEYKTVERTDSYPLEGKQLDEIGREGWELVNFVVIANAMDHMKFYYVFKREVEHPYE